MKILINKMENELCFRIDVLSPEHAQNDQEIFNLHAVRELKKIYTITDTTTTHGGKLLFYLEKPFTIDEIKIDIERTLSDAFPFIQIDFTYNDRTKK